MAGPPSATPEILLKYEKWQFPFLAHRDRSNRKPIPDQLLSRFDGRLAPFQEISNKLSTMWPRRSTGVILTLVLVTIPSTAMASEQPGGPCLKVSTATIFSGNQYRCTKINQKLIWVKSATVNKSAKGKTTHTSSAPTGKQQQTISVPALNSMDITTGIFPGLLSTNSKLPITLNSNSPLNCAIQNQNIVLLQTGTCSITATQPGNDKYLPAKLVLYSFEIKPPTITSDSSLLADVQTYIRVPKGVTYAGDTAELTLTTFSNDATAKVCANDPSALGCTLINSMGVADPTSQTKYIEFVIHVKNLDANPLPTISYRLLGKGVLSDIEVGVNLETLNGTSIGSNETADGSLFGLVPINLNLAGAYLLIDEGITDSSTRLLLSLSN